ncbi:DUF3379 domain-containing protein [Vibrio sp. TRT 21S02]|uniref:DUF3379 domain-containing protein n=1 Tax=unclassified Vibrio TaxID=2614977 RepID=UPI00349F78BB
MDDLEFRRRIMSDPKKRDNDILEAIRSSEKNSKFVDDIMDLDAQIAKAMNVDVPDDLADRILFNQTSAPENNVVKPNFARKAMAMAASVAFVAGLLVGQINWGNVIVSPAQASLANTAVQHVLDENAFIAPLDEQVNVSQINAKMQPFAKELDNDFPYHVYYLNHCGFGDSHAVHMVFKGVEGKVTLFLTPTPSKSTFDFEKQGMSGIVEPVGNNSMIIVGEQGEDVAKIAERIAKIIKPMG